MTTEDMTRVDAAIAGLEEDLAIVEAEANLAKREDDQGWIIDWMMEQLFMLDQVHACIDANAERLHKQADARRKALEWKYGQMFQVEAEKRLRALKKGKSVQTFFGRFGYRQAGGKPMVTITDEAQAIAAAKLTAPEAVTVKESLSKESIKELHAKGIDLPGTRVDVTPKHDEFYIKPEAKELPGKAQHQLEGEEE